VVTHGIEGFLDSRFLKIRFRLSGGWLSGRLLSGGWLSGRLLSGRLLSLSLIHI
jgi:hypothetical protein